MKKWIIEFDKWRSKVKVSLDANYENCHYWHIETIGMDGVE